MPPPPASSSTTCSRPGRSTFRRGRPPTSTPRSCPTPAASATTTLRPTRCVPPPGGRHGAGAPAQGSGGQGARGGPRAHERPRVTSGILNVNKPAGPSSFAVVRTLRRLPGVLKAGHAGTLDPAAEGVLPILINGATRLADFVHEWPKTYVATLTFGFTSDTGDREGTLTAAADPQAISRARIEAALPAFLGRIGQVPPIYSSLKQAGEALYRKDPRAEAVGRHPRGGGGFFPRP